MPTEFKNPNIREDKNVKGILIGDKEIIISQLADDTTCFLRDLLSLENVLHIFDNFKICTGLKVNIKEG